MTASETQTCPICDRTFAKVQGLRTHLSLAHYAKGVYRRPVDRATACLFDDGGSYCYTHSTFDDHPLVVVPGVPSIPGGAL